MKAVIIAGGMGERMRPLTNSIPKALAPIDGVPIIRRQIDQLIDLGVTSFVVLTGYRADMIEAYLKSIYKNSVVEIVFVQTPKEFEPAERLLSASEWIIGDFLLLYCDNFIESERSIAQVIESNAPITFLAEKREVGNLSIDGKVVYSSQRNPSSPFVELGYIHVKTEDFMKVLYLGHSLQESLSLLSLELNCKAIVTKNELSSVSNLSRFRELRSKRKMLLLDRDGVLNVKMPPRKYLGKIEDYELLDANIDFLARHFGDTTDFIIITNQPGVATGEVDPVFLDKLHSRMIVEILLRGVSIVGIYVCVHHWDDNCDCRKPKPGMIKQAILDYELKPQELVYIGDELKDYEAAIAAGITGVVVGEFYGPNVFPDLNSSYDFITSIITR